MRRGVGTTQIKKRGGGERSRSVHAIECIDEDVQGDGMMGEAGPSQTLDIRNVRSKVSDFARFFEDVADENENLKKELATAQTRLTIETSRAAAVKAEHETAVGDLKQTVSEQDASIVSLRNEHIDLQLELNSVLIDRNELLNLRSVVSSAKSQLKDYITLETTAVSLITTSGQVLWFFPAESMPIDA